MSIGYRPPLFARPQYEALVAALRPLPLEAALVDVLLALSEALARDNALFRAGDFMERCLEGK